MDKIRYRWMCMEHCLQCKHCTDYGSSNYYCDLEMRWMKKKNHRIPKWCPMPTEKKVAALCKYKSEAS